MKRLIVILAALLLCGCVMPAPHGAGQADLAGAYSDVQDIAARTKDEGPLAPADTAIVHRTATGALPKIAAGQSALVKDDAYIDHHSHDFFGPRGHAWIFTLSVIGVLLALAWICSKAAEGAATVGSGGLAGVLALLSHLLSGGLRFIDHLAGKLVAWISGLLARGVSAASEKAAVLAPKVT